MYIPVTRLIVLSGDAGAGKDSVAKILTENHGWKLYSLAAPLKRFAEDMFMFTDEQLYGPSAARNAPDPRWARPCDACNSKGLIFGEIMMGEPPVTVRCHKCLGMGKINDNSPRRVLQLLGEEYLRQMIHVDALTIRARGDIETWLLQGIKVVVNDARNDNDRNNLHEWLGAKRVDVRTERKKDAKAKDAWRLHASEQRKATDDQLEYVIRNDEDWPFPSLPSSVEKMLNDLYK